MANGSGSNKKSALLVVAPQAVEELEIGKSEYMNMVNAS